MKDSIEGPEVRISKEVLVSMGAKVSQGTERDNGPKGATRESEVELRDRGMWERSNPRHIEGGIVVGRDIHVAELLEGTKA